MNASHLSGLYFSVPYTSFFPVFFPSQKREIISEGQRTKHKWHLSRLQSSAGSVLDIISCNLCSNMKKVGRGKKMMDNLLAKNLVETFFFFLQACQPLYNKVNSKQICCAQHIYHLHLFAVANNNKNNDNNITKLLSNVKSNSF